MNTSYLNLEAFCVLFKLYLNYFTNRKKNAEKWLGSVPTKVVPYFILSEMKLQDVTKDKKYFYLFLFRILVCSGK